MKRKKTQAVGRHLLLVLSNIAILTAGHGAVCSNEELRDDLKDISGPIQSVRHGSVIAQIDVVPKIAECTDLLFAAEFSEGGVPEKWIPLHGTQWSVVEGTLRGEPSTKEFQDRRIASGNSSHTGKTPSSRILIPVDDCVVRLRFKLADNLSGVHFGFNDGSVKTGTGHVCRFTVSTRKGQSLVKDKNVTLNGDEDEVLVSANFNIKADTWYWMVLEIVEDEMVAQVSGGPVLRARHPRFNVPKDQINLPTRGGGVVFYDQVRIWKAVRKK